MNIIKIKNKKKLSAKTLTKGRSTFKLFTFLTMLLFSSITIAEQASESQVSELFVEAQKLLQQSNQLEEQAKQSLLAANKTRQLISKKRVESRKESDALLKTKLEQNATELAKQLDEQQKSGASQRMEALQKKYAAMTLFSQGLANKWKDWINNTQPLTMDKETLDYISHNAVVRSVHPTMLNKMGLNKEKNNISNKDAKPESLDSDKGKMSLRIASLIGQSAPADLDISAFQLSNDQKYLAHIEVHNSSDAKQTNVSQVPLNQMHQWRLLISDLQGNPVSGKTIEVLGHMPGHVHGLPTQPQITQVLDEGVYLVEGVKFQMQGWWVMQFELPSSNQATKKTSNEENYKSTFTFNLIL